MSGDKIPPIDPETGQFVRPSDGNKVYKTETELTKGLLMMRYHMSCMWS